jgi:SSS family solute:Na+ symporter
MLAGGVLCLLFVLGQLPGGFAQVIEVGQAHHKFSLGSLSWDPHQRTFWTVIILGLVNWLNVYSGEQTVVQRYVSAKSLWEARKATLMFSGIAVPMWTMFFFIGTSLFVFFRVVPDPNVAQLQPDQVLPYFVLTHIPVGVAGLVIASVIAAAMSSLDSGVNSISTVVVIDLLKAHLARGRSDRFYLQAARLVAGAAIALMTFGAFAFSRMEKESMNDVSLIVFSVLGGAITGLYMVGFFTRRVDGKSANIALGIAIAFNIYLGFGLLRWLPESWRIGLHSYWVGAVVNLLFIVLAYAISLWRRVPPQKLEGLTVWTMNTADTPAKP